MNEIMWERILVLLLACASCLFTSISLVATIHHKRIASSSTGGYFQHAFYDNTQRNFNSISISSSISSSSSSSSSSSNSSSEISNSSSSGSDNETEIQIPVLPFSLFAHGDTHHQENIAIPFLQHSNQSSNTYISTASAAATS